MDEDASVMLVTGRCLVERCWRGDRRGADEGATPARAGPVVAVDHLGVPHRRRGAGTGQSLAYAPPTVAWWVGVAVAAVVTIAVVLTYRGITVASALARWVWDASADMRDSSPDPEATLSPGCTPAIDHRRRFGRDVVGVRDTRASWSR